MRQTLTMDHHSSASHTANAPHPLHGRSIAIATMHGKEAVLVPPLQHALAMTPVLCQGLDTDAFGTFVGDIPRTGTALETARRKARAGMQHCRTQLALASEGSFGPHPSVPLLPLAVELVLLLDDATGLEVMAEDISTETNFASVEVQDLAAAQEFAARIGFPEHQLVVTVTGAPEATVRGIGEMVRLEAVLAPLLREHGVVRLQTDMRADRNPTRMRAIGRAGSRLVERLLNRCSMCKWPGFGAVELVRGLPCMACGEPLELVRAVVHGCARCEHRTELPRSDGRTECDPGECQWCNP